jgi:hypothetical protein
VQSLVRTATASTGSLPFEETAEEIRLADLKLLGALWARATAEQWGHKTSSASNGEFQPIALTAGIVLQASTWLQ